MADKVLNRDDVAKRTEYAIVRALRVLMDVRQQEGDLYQDVRGSRFLSNAGDLLAAELAAWGFKVDRPKYGEEERCDLPSVRSD